MPETKQGNARIEKADTDLTDAFRLADIADSISIAYFGRKDLSISRKVRGSIVTAADREIELTLRKHLAEVRPDDGMIGEEFGETFAGPRRWIIDPIDGTAAYACGSSAFATLIALETEGTLELGLVSAPALKRRWWAVRGGGSFADGRPMRVSATSNLAAARVALADSEGWSAVRRLQARSAIIEAVKNTRTYDNFLSHMLVAEGLIDAALEPSAALWDLAAVQVIISEAGGCLTDLSGNHGAAGGSGLGTNGLIHDELMQIIQR